MKPFRILEKPNAFVPFSFQVLENDKKNSSHDAYRDQDIRRLDAKASSKETETKTCC